MPRGMETDQVAVVSATEAVNDANVRVKVSRKQPVHCGCAFAAIHKWGCCEAINDANWLKKEKADRKQARLHATAMRKKARLAARAALKKEKKVVKGKKSTVKSLKKRTMCYTV
jgi:hypothetical protein